jgi:hypothetical protein
MAGGEVLVPFGIAVDVLMLVLAVLALVCGVRAVATTASQRGDASAVAVVFVLVAVFIGTALTMFFPILPLSVLPLTGTVFVVALVRLPGTTSRRLPLVGRMLVAAPFVLATVAVVWVGYVHITVWNPRAKIPGLTLDEIYAEMRAAGEGPSNVVIIGWAALCLLAVLLFLVACALPRFAKALDARRIAVIGLFIVGFACIFFITTGFGMGMSLADTFGTTGGDAIATGQAITMLGRLAICAAMLVAFLPAQEIQTSTSKPDVPVVV